MPVQTTAGPVPAAELGFTSMHEHVMMFPSRGIETMRYEMGDLLGGTRITRDELDIPWPDGRDGAMQHTVIRLAAARAAGLQTLVDCTPAELGRDLSFVAEAARQADVRVIVSTGLMGKLPAPFAYFEAAGLDASVDVFVRDLEEGIGDTGIRAGAFKTALGFGNHHDPGPDYVYPAGITPDAALLDGLPPSAEFALRAAARTQARTGVLVNVHTASTYRTGLMVCEVMAKEGADLTRVSLHHAGETDDFDYLHGMLDQGVSLCMDPHRYAWRLPNIARLVAEGYARQLILAVDSVLLQPAPMLPDFWFEDPAEWAQREPEWLPEFVPLDVVPRLRELGVGDAEIALMTTDNPARLLEIR